MKNFKGTQGECKVEADFREPTVLNESNQVMFTHNKACYDTSETLHTYYSHNKMVANAELVANAFTTISKCDLLPSELLEQRNELLEALQGLIDPVTGMVSDEVAFYIGSKKAYNIEQAINKALGQ